MAEGGLVDDLECGADAADGLCDGVERAWPKRRVEPGRVHGFDRGQKAIGGAHRQSSRNGTCRSLSLRISSAMRLQPVFSLTRRRWVYTVLRLMARARA